MKTIPCPICKKAILWNEDFPYRPFCSERCRTVDLGAWADGSYAIPTKETPEEVEGTSEDE